MGPSVNTGAALSGGAYASAIAVVEIYPEPAVLLLADGRPAALSATAAALLNGGFEAELLSPLIGGSAAADTGQSPGGRPLSILREEGGDRALEWTPVALREGATAYFGRDVTFDRNLRDALVESRQRFRDLVELAGDFVWETGPDGRFAYVSPKGALGHVADALIGQPAWSVLGGGTEPLRSPFQTRASLNGVEHWMRRADGSLAAVLVWAHALSEADGGWAGARGLCRDITETREREADLARAQTRERLTAHLVQAMRDASDPRRGLKVAAESARFAVGAVGCAIFLYDRPDHLTLAAADGDYGALGQPESMADAAADLLNRCIAGQRPLVESLGDCTIVAVPTYHHREANGAMAIWRRCETGGWSEDEMAMIQSAADQLGIGLANAVYLEQLQHLAERDGLTGLYNRRTVMTRIRERLDAREQGTSALLYVDLNSFKACNDAFGHQRGDAVLVDVANMVRSVMDSGDVAGRMGGDEFVLWLDGAPQDLVETTAQRLVELGETLVPLSAGAERPLGLAIGVAVYAHDADESLTALVSRADHTMYRAKQDAAARQISGAWALSSDARDGEHDGE